MGEALNPVLEALTSTAGLIVLAAIIAIGIVLVATFRRRPTVVPVIDEDKMDQSLSVSASAAPPKLADTLFHGEARTPGTPNNASAFPGLLLLAGIAVALLSVIVLPRLGGTDEQTPAVPVADAADDTLAAAAGGSGDAGDGLATPVAFSAGVCRDDDRLASNNSGFLSPVDSLKKIAGRKPHEHVPTLYRFDPSETAVPSTYRLCLDTGYFAYFDLMEISLDGTPLLAPEWNDGPVSVPAGSLLGGPLHGHGKGLGSTPAYRVAGKASLAGKMPVLTAVNGPTSSFGLTYKRADMLPPAEALAASGEAARNAPLDIYDGFLALGAAAAQDPAGSAQRRSLRLANYVLSELRQRPGAANCKSRARVLAASATSFGDDAEARRPVIIGVRFDTPGRPDAAALQSAVEAFLRSDGMRLPGDAFSEFALGDVHVNAAACKRDVLHFEEYRYE